MMFYPSGLNNLHWVQGHAGNERRSGLSRFSRWLCQKTVGTIESIPLPQAIIVMLAAGITLGTVLYNNVGIALEVSRNLTAYFVITIGFLSLWQLQHNKAKSVGERIMLGIGTATLMLIIGSRALQFTNELIAIIHNISAVIFSLVLFYQSSNPKHQLNKGIQNDRMYRIS